MRIDIKRLFGETLILISCFQLSVSAQTPPPYQPNVIPPSPNASTLVKFSDVPVSPYTGTSDVTIPIYNVSAKGVSVPVSLNYHTGGIRLKEESGWVGLGWALNAGGSISRTIMDKDDFSGQGYFNSFVPQITTDMAPFVGPGAHQFGLFGYDFLCNYTVNTVGGLLDYTNVFSSSAPSYDLEADIFSYSFPGHSGKFTITRDHKILIQKQENIQIQFDLSGNSFTILDDQGNKYYFYDKEYTMPYTGGQRSTSSWMLSKIVSQLKDSVMFNYVADSTWTFVQSDIFQTNRDGCSPNTGFSQTQGAGTLYSNVTLQNIDFKNGQVQFSFDSSRADLTSGKKLNAVKVFSKTSAGLNYLNEFDLYYSYFNGQYNYSPITEFQRLRLDSVKELSGSLSLPPYVFSYNTPNLQAAFTAKHSFNIDHWGFFNGVYNSILIPSYQATTPNWHTSTYYSYSGANRNPDTGYVKSFSLQQIKYPTGGKTVFEYEANDYDYFNSQTGPPDFQQVNLVDTSVNLVINARGTTTGTIDLSSLYTGVQPTMTVTFTTQSGDQNAPVYRNQNGYIYFNFASTTVDMSSLSLNCTQNSMCTTPSPIPLTVTNAPYTWTARIDPSIGTDFSGIYVTVHWKALSQVLNNNPTLTASGLRIKTISDYSDDTTFVKKRSYTYSYTKNVNGAQQMFTYGRLMSFPEYAHYEDLLITPGGTPTECIGLVLSSSSNTSLTSVAQGNIVGYDQVTEYTRNASNVDIGKTVYTFSNISDSIYTYYGWRLPGVPNMGNNMNGLLLSKKVYLDSNGVYNEVEETDNYYHLANRIPFFNLKYNYIYLVGTSGNLGCPGGLGTPNQFLACFYPSIKSERVLLDSTEHMAFSQKGGYVFVDTKNKSFYDNPIHYQLTRSSSVDSKGNTHVEQVKYPQDYIPNGQSYTGNTILDTMIGKNMVSEVIEKRDSVYPGTATTGGSVTGAQLSLYRLLTGNAVSLDQQFKLDQAGPVSNFQPFAISGNTLSQDSRYRKMINFDTYDNYYNIQQYTTSNQGPVAILWDYNNIYPIAQVKNAILSNIAYTSFEADGNGGWTIGSPTRNTSNGITGSTSYVLSNGNIVKSGLTTGKQYIVSYWAIGGPATVNGVGATTGLTKKGWTFYQHLLPNTTATVTVSGTATIDELRLFPIDAQMTTYTYQPLIGMINNCSVNNQITYYEYDNLQRLKLIRDQDGNIIKTIDYYYKQPGTP